MDNMLTETDSFAIATEVGVGASDLGGELFERSTAEGGELPTSVGYDEYQRYVGETWHQRGQECTGFALAAIANYLTRRDLDDPGAPSVSRRMLYEMAQIHDGEEFGTGSTLRGAIEGWTRTGVATDDLWPYDASDEYGTVEGGLTLRRLLDARARPLMKHRRVAGGDVDTARDALAQGHPLFTGTIMHEGWYRLFLPDTEPLVERRQDDEDKGGHAFVIVGYDSKGFWIHNSWGPEWGTEGYALLPFDEWERSGFDAWVVDAKSSQPEESLPGVETTLSTRERTASYRDLWPHLMVLDDEGELVSGGLYEMDKSSLGTLMYLFGERTAHWKKRRLAIVCDGGYLPPSETIERFRAVRDQYLDAEIYPIFIVWETSWWRDLADELSVWINRLDEDGTTNDPVECDNPIVRRAIDRSVLPKIWKELGGRTARAVNPTGGASLLAEAVSKKRTKIPFDLHLHSHGVGDVLAIELGSLLPAPIGSATAVASAVAEPGRRSRYVDLLDAQQLGHLTIVALDEEAEASDTVGPIRGSLLRLASDGLAAPGMSFLGLANQAEVLLGDADERYELIRWPSSNHLSLAWDPAIHELAIRGMLTNESPESQRQHAPSKQAVKMPTDPLAFAQARLLSD
jgi:hypothetical protein